jgi:hypothetical protein
MTATAGNPSDAPETAADRTEDPSQDTAAGTGRQCGFPGHECRIGRTRTVTAAEALAHVECHWPEGPCRS